MLKFGSSDKLFFTADTHFYHKNILAFTDRPYKTVDEMNWGLVDLWNQKVDNSGIVFVLGDFSFENDYIKTEKIISSLNGKKYLIRGNHDYFSTNVYKLLGFAGVFDYCELWVNKRTHICLSHYPLFTWNRMYRKSWLLYGHVHGRYMANPEIRNSIFQARLLAHRAEIPEDGFKDYTFDVGIDTPGSGCTPFSINEIREFFNDSESV